MEIKQMYHVINFNTRKFYNDLNEFVVETQNDGLSVDIQYSTSVDLAGKLIHSALVIGREIK